MLSGHFISGASGKLFLTQFGEINSEHAILCLPSITEELNLGRAVIAKQAQLMAENGLSCFVLDYYGTGDSEGEIKEASCANWLEDILIAGNWLKDRGINKITLWGVRFGALLMLANQKSLHQQLPIVHQVLWKPVLNGKQFASQFLRIKQANSMLNDGEMKVNWREHVYAGNTLEVAGYEISSNLLESIDTQKVPTEFTPLSPVDIFELASENPMPVTKKLVAGWPDELYRIHCFQCPAFWQVPEIFSLPELAMKNLHVFTMEF